jgi:hypothetical protein
MLENGISTYKLLAWIRESSPTCLGVAASAKAGERLPVKSVERNPLTLNQTVFLTLALTELC